MAKVGVGVPVFNGAAYLRESLECLANQSFRDMEIVISDNASTDGTAEICAEFAARDPRFRHLRQSENIGMTPNFVAAREACSAPLFMWRAYDDLSALDYVEKLVALHDADPKVRLAVALVQSHPDDRRRPRIFPYRKRARGPRIRGVLHDLFASHATWIYGLWERETVARLEDRVHAAYDYAWGWDHLTLLSVLLDGQVAGTNETFFLQRIIRAHTTRAERLAKRASVATMRRLREQFEIFCQREVAARDWTALETWLLKLILPAYVDRRGYRRRKLARRARREGEGTAGLA